MELVLVAAEQPALVAVVGQGRRAADLAAEDLDDGDEGQDQQDEREQGAEAPGLLALVGEGHRGVAERLRQHGDAHRGADGAGRHEHEPDDLRDAVELLVARVQVPGGQEEDDGVDGDDGDGAKVRQPDVGRPAAARGVGVGVPDARDGQRRVGQVGLDGLEHEAAVDAAERQVDKHEELPQPAQNPMITGLVAI